MEHPRHAPATTARQVRAVVGAFLRLGLTSSAARLRISATSSANSCGGRPGWTSRRSPSYWPFAKRCRARPAASSALPWACAAPAGVAAWPRFCGFTPPSALLMFGAALHLPALLHAPLGIAVLHGLELQLQPW